jgi:autotransporter-associated beta strand protein
MAVGVSVGSNNQSTQFSGNIVGLGPFKKVGTGKLTLTGANTYSGTTAVTSGILQVKTPGSLPGYNNLSSVKVTVSSSATLAVNAGGSGEWSSTNIKDLLTYSTFSSGSTLGIDTTGGDSSYEYAIGGEKNLTKLGTGNLTLTGELNYSGTTKIDGGTLTIASTSANLHNIVGSGSLVVGDGLHDAQLSATSICVDSLTISGPSPIVPVPEPSTIALLATALGTCLYWICRKR